jgi:hypothetical protein
VGATCTLGAKFLLLPQIAAISVDAVPSSASCAPRRCEGTWAGDGALSSRDPGSQLEVRPTAAHTAEVEQVRTLRSSRWGSRKVGRGVTRCDAPLMTKRELEPCWSRWRKGTHATLVSSRASHCCHAGHGGDFLVTSLGSRATIVMAGITSHPGHGRGHDPGSQAGSRAMLFTAGSRATLVTYHPAHGGDFGVTSRWR